MTRYLCAFRAFLSITLVVAAIFFAGCASSPAPETPVSTQVTTVPVPTTAAGTPAPVPTMIMTPASGGSPSGPSVTAPAVPAGSGVSVTIKNLEFSPATVTVKAGTPVTWTNLDEVPHTVTSKDPSPESFDSGLFSKGETFSRTFTVAGTYPYYCTVHPFMKATVIVTA